MSITLELLVYLFLALISLFLRLGAASRSLLNHEEVLRALAARDFVQGQAPEPSWPLSPVFLGLQSLTFFLFGPGDITARLPTILAGAFAPLAFAFLRRVLGKERALVAGFISTFSPLWLFSSLQADGETIGALMFLIAVGAFFWYQEDKSLPWLYIAACALGLGMASGLSFWTLAGEGVILAAMLKDKTKPNAGFWIALGGSFFLGSTVLLFYPPGLGLAADSFVLWFSRLFDGHFSLRPLFTLIMYEFLLLIAALGARKSLHLVVPASFGLVVAILNGLEGPAGLLPILLPLTILSADGLCNLIRGLTLERFHLHGLVALGMILCLAVLGFLGLASYTLIGEPRYLLITLGATTGIATALVILGLTHGPEVPAEVFLVFLLVTSFLWEVKMARGLNFSPYIEEHIPRCQFTSPKVKEVADSLRKLSSYRTGDPSALEVVLVGEIPELVWYLRDFPLIKVEENQPLPQVEAIITPAEKPVSLGENFYGRQFTIREECEVKGLRGYRLLRWLLYYEPIAPRVEEKATLWVKKE